MERIILSQNQKIDYLVAMQRQQSFCLTAPPTPTTPRTPTFHQRQLPDFDTPTRDERPDTPVTPSIPPVMPLFLPTTPTAPTTVRSVPMHLFADIPEGVRLSENDLNQAASSSTTPGAFAVSLLKYLFQELFTADNLRVYFSYRGGGKLNKRPLDDTRKQYLRRYVTAFYPSVTLDSAYTAMVIEKINQFLRRPIQQKKYGLKDEVRDSLYDSCRLWTKTVGKRKFLGGDKPNLADLSVYGVLTSIEGCQAFEDTLNNTKIGPWFYRMKDACTNHKGSSSSHHS
ncbi:microsomal prostaglandin-E synthase 2 [Mytilus galloprovincialis]|uniref:Microsomal prostaglandin-E synthase 2 n=1 Tax=Mytilus galloprovincialis TaxID=29158 RepID=A0A8B6HCE8_MYTGA|nr:microsomal prostaglandin-E synthase 2 [Mytilus galloprovincialis]